MKQFTALFLILAMLLSLSACGGKDKPANTLDLSAASWDQIEEAARGTTVAFYGWGGDEDRNNWLANVGAPYMKEHYDITLEVVGMNIDEILAKLAGEKEAGSAAGEEGAGLSAGGALSPPHPARQLRTMTTVRKSAIVLSFMMFPPI